MGQIRSCGRACLLATLVWWTAAACGGDDATALETADVATSPPPTPAPTSLGIKGSGSTEPEEDGPTTTPLPPDGTGTTAAGGEGADTAMTLTTAGRLELGRNPLPTDSDSHVPAQTTPAALEDRRLATTDLLPPPSSGGFESSIGALAGDPLARSTWEEGCPVAVADLRYLTVSFWGFDERAHTGELIVHRQAADDLVEVFRRLFEVRYPIEEMRVATRADLDAPPTGDGNNTTAFVCRAVTGGTSFSEHAYGLAIDVNPFHNPYEKGSVVLPELAAAYLDRDRRRPGMIVEGDAVVDAFEAVGWGWGGRWSSLKDYQHFALHDR